MDPLQLLATLLADHPAALSNIFLIIGVASIADALLPVPALDSPWYRARRTLSTVAANVGKARNAIFAVGPTAGPAGVATLVGALVQPSTDGERTGAAPHDAIRDALDRLDPTDPTAYTDGLARIARLASDAHAPNP